MKYKALFFDLDDTLWAYTQNAEETFREVYDLHQLGRYFISFEHFHSLYLEKNKEMWNAYGRGMIDRTTLDGERFRYPLERVGVYDADLVQSYSTSFFERIVQQKRLMPGAMAVLEKLYPHYPLYIISNGFSDLQSKKMEAAGIHSFFEELILSDVVGYNKPHSKIFLEALKTAQVSPKEALMIGDNWNADICGAKQVGIDQVYLGAAVERDFEATYSIENLEDLLGILK